jgi:hypothetical protein
LHASNASHDNSAADAANLDDIRAVQARHAFLRNQPHLVASR